MSIKKLCYALVTLSFSISAGDGNSVNNAAPSQQILNQPNVDLARSQPLPTSQKIINFLNLSVSQSIPIPRRNDRYKFVEYNSPRQKTTPPGCSPSSPNSESSFKKNYESFEKPSSGSSSNDNSPYEPTPNYSNATEAISPNTVIAAAMIMNERLCNSNNANELRKSQK